MRETEATWTAPYTVSDEHGDYQRLALLVRGFEVGDVEWFFDDGPFYPHANKHRFGAFSTIAGACKAVESATMLDAASQSDGGR